MLPIETAGEGEGVWGNVSQLENPAGNDTIGDLRLNKQQSERTERKERENKSMGNQPSQVIEVVRGYRWYS